ncbi:MAG TPA: protein kinase [Thermoanaerobaculia bacterium]
MTLAAGMKLGAYEILGPLGSGGMGEVYRARDSKLERDVAVKVLPASVARDPESLARFEREAKAVAALSHPNILAIHDFGRQDDVVYAVMELLEGQTLRGKLDAGPVSQKQAVDYGLQIAKGLSAAHERGIVHRDLKPENVFVTKDGHVKILDFGLAKRVEAAGREATNAPTADGQTEPGKVMGTVGYMSPEQVKGLAVDQRSDIFSFGTILYELLSGKRAFKRDTSAETIAAILTHEPPELTVSGQVPVALDHVVRHCLEKDPGNRFQSAKDVAFALSEASGPTTLTSGVHAIAPAAPARKSGRLIAIVAMLVLAAIAGFLWMQRGRRSATGAASGVKRIAVLPFENLGSPEDDYFADGISDEIRGKLTGLSGVEVIARGSSTPYKKTTKTPKQIAEELNVSYLLTATVRWEKAAGASRVHVSPELVDVSQPDAPTSKWQQPFDAALTDVFKVQSDIATRVAEALGVALGEGQRKQLSDKPTQNLAAYDAFLKGEEASGAMARNDPPSQRRGLTSYEQAVALDPSFALAWSRISAANSLLYSNAVPSPQLADRAREGAEKAIGLAPSLPDGYQAMGTFYRLVEADPSRALQEFERGRKVAPDYAPLLRGVGLAERTLGRWESALDHLRQALRLDPRGVSNLSVVGDTLLRLRRSAEARQAYDGVLRLQPQNVPAIEKRAMTYLSEGDLKGARDSVSAGLQSGEPTELVAYLAQYNDLVWLLDDSQRELLLRLPVEAFDGDRSAWAICHAQAYAFKGDAANLRVQAEAARQAIEEQLRAVPNDDQRRVILGLALAYLGKKEEAVREGLRGLALRSLTKDAESGAYNQHQLARIYILVGEPEKALDQLEPLLKVPYFLSPAWLTIDPNFDPLRGNPRFQKLVAGASAKK